MRETERMKPIYMSANYEQVDIVKDLLTEKSILTTLVAKEDTNNALAPKGIIWFELWLKRESDLDAAETAIEQYEFEQIKSSLKVTWEAIHSPPPKETSAETSEKPKVAIRSNLSKEKRQEIMQAAYESWAPVNNQKVFHRLGALLGFTEEEIENGDYNNLRRPWNPDRLKNQVKALQQLCKVRSLQRV